MRVELLEKFDRTLDIRLAGGRQMEAAQNSIDALHAADRLRLSHGIYNASMGAASNDQQALSF